MSNNSRFLFCVFISILFLNSATAQFRSEKKGIAFGYLNEKDLATISKGMSWWYNWYVQPEGTAVNYENYDMDFVPMLWNGSSDTAKLRDFLQTHPNVKYILGFNEPNFRTQANMTPAQVAANWPKIEELADEFGLKIVGPAVNYCDQCVDIPGTTADSDPYNYLDAFFAACPTCRVDYIAVHNYMCYNSALQSYIKGFLKYKKKIWLTEFACWDQATITLDMQKSLALSAIDYLENDSNIFRYSWFTGDRKGSWPYIDILAPKAGELTELGNLYVNFYPVHDEKAFFPIPSRIEAESYSKMAGIQIETTQDFDGLANIGYFDGGDWLQYNVDAPESQEYQLYLRISSNANTSIEIRENGEKLASLTIPSSGGWQNWKTYNLPLNLTKGQHKLQLYSATGSLNVNWIAFTKAPNNLPTVISDEDSTITLPQSVIYLTSTAEDLDGTQLQYKWTLVSGKTNCVIKSPLEANTEITNLQEGKYTFRVTVSDGIATAYDDVKVTVQKTTEVEQNEFSQFIVYPNPAKSKINIELKKVDGAATLSVIAADGRVRIQHEITGLSSEINVETLEKGVYLINVESQSGCLQTTFIIE